MENAAAGADARDDTVLFIVMTIQPGEPIPGL